jgi:hypothetical protein
MNKEDFVVMFVLYLPVMSLSYFAFCLVARRIGLSYEPTNEK